MCAVLQPSTAPLAEEGVDTALDDRHTERLRRNKVKCATLGGRRCLRLSERRRNFCMLQDKMSNGLEAVASFHPVAHVYDVMSS